MKTNRGFTLIELLVVISVIGMLSSIVLASLSSARDKGRIAAGMIFAKNVYHTNGDQALFFWDFENVTSDTITERTPSGATISGSYRCISGVNCYSSMISPETYFGTGHSLSLLFGDPEHNQYINLGVNPIFIQNQISIVAWIKASSEVGGSGHKTIVADWPNYWFYLDPDSLNIRGDSFNTRMYGNFNLLDDKWHQVAVTVKSGMTNGSVLYLDGRILPGSYDGPNYITLSNVQSAVFAIANKIDGASDSHYFKGKLDDVAVYPTYLLASDIQHLYAEGLKQHSDVAGAENKNESLLSGVLNSVQSLFKR